MVVIRSITISDAGGQCETKQRLSWTRGRVVAGHCKKDDLLNCWTSSSDNYGYHADFHEGHGTIGAWQGHSTAWTRHAMCESAFSVPRLVVSLTKRRKTWIMTDREKKDILYI